MRVRDLIIAVLVIAVLAGCAAPKPVDEKARLRAELARWEDFTTEGIVQVSYMGISLRKMFVLAKTRDEIRFDVLDGGALAMQSKPLLSAYMGQYISIQSPFAPQLEKLSGAALQQNPLSFFGSLDSLVATYGDEIIANRKISAGTMEITFDRNLRVERAVDSQSKSSVLITYRNNGDPDRVVIALDAKTSLELLPDKIEYGKTRIVPLPRPEPQFLLQQFLEENAYRLIPKTGDTE